MAFSKNNKKVSTDQFHQSLSLEQTEIMEGNQQLKVELRDKLRVSVVLEFRDLNYSLCEGKGVMRWQSVIG